MSDIKATGHFEMETGTTTITATLGEVTATLSWTHGARDQDVEILAKNFYPTVDLVAGQMAEEALRRDRGR